MGLPRRLKTEEERENEHNTWLERKIYAKTPLTTYMNCPHKFYLRYVRRKDEYWGEDLVIGLGGHKLLEEYHERCGLVEENPEVSRGSFTPDEQREIYLEEVNRLMHRLEGGHGAVRDAFHVHVHPLVSLYRRHWPYWYQRVLGLEETWGGEGEIQFGGYNIGGHTDLRAGLNVQDPSQVIAANQGKTPYPIVVDFKFCGVQSAYRRPKKLDIGGELYRAMTGAKRTFILPLVRGAKRRPKNPDGWVAEDKPEGIALIDTPREVRHTIGTKRVIELVVHDACAAIERGDLDRSAPSIGTGLCQPKYCSFFGRGCKYTDHLSRENWS